MLCQCTSSNMRRLAQSAGAAVLGAADLAQRPWAAMTLCSASSLGPIPQGEAFDTAPGRADSPVLLRLPSRQWGAAAHLSQDVVKAAAGGKTPSRIAVVRDCFAAYDQQQRPFSLLFRSLGSPPDGSTAVLGVASELALPATRAVVDSYHLQPSSGRYVLQDVAVDLLRYLRRAAVQPVLMPDVNTPRPNHQNGVVAASRGINQSTNEVLMVAPTAFGFNEQAATDNSFMQRPEEGVTRQVLREFAGLHHQLTEVAGVKDVCWKAGSHVHHLWRVLLMGGAYDSFTWEETDVVWLTEVNLFEHSRAHGTPDACFPNNWCSTHLAGEANGGTKQSTLVLYPMKHPNRAAERRADIIGVLKQRGYDSTYDMTGTEAKGNFLEGTGVLVLDRVNGVAYVNVSERADEYLARQWVERLGYKDLVTFYSTDLRGMAVYHTNVMMAIGTDVAIVCGESVKDERERNNLMAKLRATHTVIDINLHQMDSLCGNALELQDGRGLPVMAMSTQAYNAFTEDQRKVMRRHVADIIHAPIDTLERVGGGSVRCCLAELF